jgi:hypothetical protein
MPECISIHIGQAGTQMGMNLLFFSICLTYCGIDSPLHTFGFLIRW